jgi:hypothetical protein
MKKLIAVLGLSMVLVTVLGGCAHDRYARRECNDCHRRCDDEERICRDHREPDCGGRRRSCELTCRDSDWCR